MVISAKSQETAITTAVTTTILDAPGASDVSRVMPGMITIRNKGSANNTLTLQKLVSGPATYEIIEFTLKGGQEWVSTLEVVLEGASDILQLVTSGTSAIDVVVNYIEDE